jgi:hypothetical protein
MGIAKLFYAIRTYQSIYMEDVTVLFDKELWGVVEDIVVGACFVFGDLQWRMVAS